MIYFYLILILITSYLFGAIPWGFVIGKAKGLDIREHGSKNIGATNVTRVIGKKWGIACFIIDFFKGLIPVIIVEIIFRHCALQTTGYFSTAIILASLGAVFGHMFPVYLGFKGGKGVSTGSGAVIAISPYAAIIGIILWLIIFKFSRYVSLASIIAAAAVAVFTVLFSNYGIYHINTTLQIFIVIVVIAVIVKHKSNIKRLLNGTENKFSKKKK